MGPHERRGPGHAAHPAAGRRRRRPHARTHRPLPRGHGRGRAGLRAGVRLRPHAAAAGRWSTASRHTADATGGEQTIRLQTDLQLGIEGDRVRARHVLDAGEEVYCSLSWARRPGLRARHRGRQAAAGGHHAATGATWLGRRPDSRPPLVRADPAFGAGDQGPDLHADRRDDRGADDIAARDAGRRAQLGLPLHLDARLDVHPAGPALPESGLGGRRVHAVRRRPRAQRRRLPADHVRHRRPAGPHRVDRGRAVRATPAPTRSGSATEPSTSARTTSSARCWTRSCCTPAAASGCRGGCGGSSQSQARCAERRLAGAGPGHLGGPRQAAALRLVQAHVLGGPRPGRQAGRDPRRRRAGGRLARHRRRRSSRTSSTTA